MTRRIARLAAAALVSGGMSMAAVGLGGGIAQADPTSGTWCPGNPVPGGFTEVDWDWTVCHNFYAMQRGYPPQIVGLKVEDGGFGGNWRLVAGENTNPCPWCL
jgi:hypothetical protein